MTETEKALDEVRRELFNVRTENIALKKELKTAVNELCLRCGQYKVEHLGGECTDCRFRKTRHGDFSDVV